MGIGPNVTRICALANYTGKELEFVNPDWSGDNTTIGEGLHEFPWGHPVSIPWSWEGPLRIGDAGTMWRHGQDVRYRAHGAPSHGEDGQLLYTHRNVLIEEYIVVAVSDGHCLLVSSVDQVTAIFDNISKAVMSVISFDLYDKLSKLPELARQALEQLVPKLEETPEREASEAARRIAAVDPERMRDTFASLSAEELDALAGGCDTPQWRVVFDKVCEGLNIVAGAAGILSGIAAALSGVALLISGGDFGVTSAVFAVISGVFAAIGAGLAVAVQIVRFVVDLANSLSGAPAAA